MPELPDLEFQIEGETFRFPNYPEIARLYATRVVEKKIPAGGYIIKAAKRYLKMLRLAEKKGNPFYFSPAHVVDYCSFLERLRHVEAGSWLYTQRSDDGVVNDAIILEPWQIWIESAIHGFRRRPTGERLVSRALELVPRKNAKALALETPIPTPSGWTTMGALKEGDLVYGPDGLPTRVVDESPVFLNHECFKLTFSNGETIVADAGHRWLTTARVDRPGRGYDNSPTGLTRVRTTKEIFETQTVGARGDRNHSLAMPEPISGAERELPIDPYLLGAWLGDGASLQSTIYCSAEDMEEMSGLLRACGVEVEASLKRSCYELRLRPAGVAAAVAGGSYSSGWRPNASRMFRDLGVLGNKHIPELYLRASVAQRIALLQGLMDTDGTINKNGLNLSLTTNLPSLRDGFSELLASLGIKHSIRENENVCNGRRVEGFHWRIQFSATRDRLPAFRLTRKLSRMREGEAGRSRSVQIVSVEPVPSVPVKCIAVDNESHLFLCGRSMLPTHNTLKLAGAAVFDLLFSGQSKPQIVIGASTENQAGRIFQPASIMINAEEDLVSRREVRVTRDEIGCTRNNGTITKLSSIGERQDGLNPSLAIFEEGHAGAASVYGVVRSAFGARPDALLRMITTAGYRAEGPAWDFQKEVMGILDGKHEDYSVFGALYTLDKEDYIDEQGQMRMEALLTNQALMQKANPMWMVGLDPAKILEQAAEARRDPKKRGEFLRTRYNIWTSAGVALVDPDQWSACESKRVDLSDFIGEKCWIGVDLASHNDMCAIALMFERDDKVYLFAQYFIPEGSALLADPDYHDMLMAWAQSGHLEITDGPEADYDRIEDRLDQIAEIVDIQEAAFDPYQSNMLSRHLFDKGVKTIRYPNNALTMTGPTDDLLGRVAGKRLVHDGNPVLAWNAGNAHGERKANGSLIPRKESENSLRKIDGFVAGVMANGLRMGAEGARPHKSEKVVEPAYKNRGLIGFDHITAERSHGG